MGKCIKKMLNVGSQEYAGVFLIFKLFIWLCTGLSCSAMES